MALKTFVWKIRCPSKLNYFFWQIILSCLSVKKIYKKMNKLWYVYQNTKHKGGWFYTRCSNSTVLFCSHGYGIPSLVSIVLIECVCLRWWEKEKKVSGVGYSLVEPNLQRTVCQTFSVPTGVYSWFNQNRNFLCNFLFSFNTRDTP